jgi:hypothetical protein
MLDYVVACRLVARQRSANIRGMVFFARSAKQQLDIATEERCCLRVSLGNN